MAILQKSKVNQGEGTILTSCSSRWQREQYAPIREAEPPVSSLILRDPCPPDAQRSTFEDVWVKMQLNRITHAKKWQKGSMANLERKSWVDFAEIKSKLSGFPMWSGNSMLKERVGDISSGGLCGYTSRWSHGSWKMRYKGLYSALIYTALNSGFHAI